MTLARLPIGLNGLATILFVRAETGSFAVAGAAAGGLAIGTAAGAPFAARAVDRLGQRVLLGLAAAHAAGLLALVGLGVSGAPAGVLVAVCVLTGALLPPTSSVMRALYPRLLAGEPELVRGAFALDAVLTETIFVAGPLLTAALVAVFSPQAALVLAAAAVVAGVSLFLVLMPSAEARGARTGKRPGGRLGALRSPGIRTLLISMLPVGFAFGALEVALPAFADDRGRPELSGVLIAIWSVASAGGGLVYGARAAHVRLARVHLVVALLLPLSLVPLALAGSVVSMALLVVPAGILIAPLIASRNELAGVVAPPDSETEAFTWPLTAMVAGVALGAATAGGIVEASGWRAAVVIAAGVAAVGAALSLARRSTLVPVTPS
jgi:MFS family permease